MEMVSESVRAVKQANYGQYSYMHYAVTICVLMLIRNVHHFMYVTTGRIITCWEN